MTNDERSSKLDCINTRINLLETTIKTLQEELLRLRYKRRRIEEKIKNKSIEEIHSKNNNKETITNPLEIRPENAVEVFLKSQENETEITNPVANGTPTEKRKERKKWAENNYIIEVNDNEATVKRRKRKLEESDQTDVFEERYPNVHLNKISPTKNKNSETSVYSTPPSSTMRFNRLRTDKTKLKDEMKAGLLKLDFKGSNIAKIPGYGERVHLE